MPLGGFYFFMELNLSWFVEITILISAVIVAIRNIYSFFRQPKKMMDKYITKEKDNILKDVAGIVEKSVNEIKKDFCENNLGLMNLLKVDRKVLRVILYREIERIYEENLEKRSLTTRIRKQLLVLYEQYEILEGNGYITGLVNEMTGWPTIPE